MYLPLVIAPFPLHGAYHDIGAVHYPTETFDGSITFVKFANKVVDIVGYTGRATIVDAYWLRIGVEIGQRLRRFDLL